MTQRSARKGVVLIIVLVVVVVLTLAVYTFTDLMLVHNEAAIYSGRQAQARMLVDSGADVIRWSLTQPRSVLDENGGVYHNPSFFLATPVALSEDPDEIGAYTVLAPDYEGITGSPIRYGLQDESERINLNFLLLADGSAAGFGRDILMTLPGMTEDIADAILDFMDTDEEPRDFGFEDYTGMNPPYTAKNGPLDSVEELLLVRGVTPELLFGADRNHNGVVEPGEGEAVGVLDPTQLGLGWAPYFTLHSAEANRSYEGFPRIYANNEDMEQLYDQLIEVFPEDWVTFIIAYRQRGQYRGEVADADVQYNAVGQLDLTVPGRTPLTQVLDLIGKRVQVTFQGDSEPQVIESPFAMDLVAMAEYLPLLMDHLTVFPETKIPGRISINRASPSILLGVPGMDEDLVDRILEARQEQWSSDDPNFRHETWLLTMGLLDQASTDDPLAAAAEALAGGGEIPGQGAPDGGAAPESGATPSGGTTPDGAAPPQDADAGDPVALAEAAVARMRNLMPFICAGGDVYRAQIVGYFQGGSVSTRVEAVFDGTNAKATVLFWRDLSHLGRGFPLDVLGVAGPVLPAEDP